MNKSLATVKDKWWQRGKYKREGGDKGYLSGWLAEIEPNGVLLSH